MRFLLILISIICLAVNLSATDIYGIIDEDTTIGPEGNPWYIPNNLTVNEDAVLTILPGSEIYVTSAYTDEYCNFTASGNNEAAAKVINIYGTLIAAGTESDSILITRYPDYPDYRWGGIRIMNENPENIRFEFCNVNYSAFIHDNINFGSCGISTKPGLIVKYCRFQDNYFCIRIFDYDIGEYLPSLIYGCNFINTEDRFIYYGNDRDDGILLQVNALEEETVIAYCNFNSMGLDMSSGKNYIINNSFNDILSSNIGVRVVDNQDFYGNHLENSTSSINLISADLDIISNFRRNTLIDFNPSSGMSGNLRVCSYENISDNYFSNSEPQIGIVENNKIYNNIVVNDAYVNIRDGQDYAENTEIYNNFMHDAVLSFWNHGNCYFYNNIIYGQDSSLGITLEDGEDDFYGFNNYTDQWSLRATYLYEGEEINYYNNIFNDIDNFVEEQPERYNMNFYNNFLTYNIPEYVVDCGGNLEDMDISLAGMTIDTLNYIFTLSDSSLCIDAGNADTTFCNWDYNYNFSPFDGDGDGIAVADIGPVEYGSFFSTGFVHCSVTDTEGIPIDIIRGEVSGECVEYTGLDGSFVMELPEGDYTLNLSSPFYENDSLLVSVTAADTSYVSIILEASYPFTEIEEDDLPKAENIYNVKVYPNPFNPQVTISFFTSESTENTEVKIYNIKGQRLHSFKIQNSKFKINEVVWDGKDDRGRAVSSGVYFAKLSVGNNAVTTKLVLIK